MKLLTKPLSREKFALAVKMHRERLNMTQDDAARVVGVSPRKWWQMEKGERDTSLAEQIGAIELLKFAKKKKNPNNPTNDED